MISSYKNIIISFIIIILIGTISFSQDTTKPVIKPVAPKDTSTLQNFILANYSNQFLNKLNPDTLTRRRFLWYPAKTLEDIFNYIPGYYMSFKDVGQINNLSFNQMSLYETGVLRHGRPINDFIDGTVDLDLLSRNEIAGIEMSNGFGNNLYNYSNTVSVIERELFQFRPYTEISFYQDRYENLYFDGNFHQNFTKKINFNMGVTKHSYDGHYTNSDFDKWLGRFNLNFAHSNKLNFFLNVNYAKIQRGLNGGINPDTVNLGDKEAVFDAADAIVNNSDAYEKKERFDIDLGSIFLIGKNSFTKVQAYVSNSFREDRDEENRPNPNGIFYQFNYHWINYGAKLQEVLTFDMNKDTRLISRTELGYDYVINDISSAIPTNIFDSQNQNASEFWFLENAEFGYKDLILTGFFRGYSNDPKEIYTFFGFKAQYLFRIDSSNNIRIGGQFDSKYNYGSAGANIVFGKNNIGSELYYYDNGSYIYKGINNNFKFRIYSIDFEGTYTYNIVPKYAVTLNTRDKIYSPNHFGNLSLAWHDMAFKNKLEYKIGLNSRFWSEYFSNVHSDWPDRNVRIPANATLDFYINGKIGKATFGLTVENILDRIVYNTGVYPFMDRGGFLNAISRFNITWSFFD